MFSSEKGMSILVLGGGAARGLANLGVLKVLEKEFGKEAFPFDMVVGTSIGSLVGAAYCLGMDLAELEERAGAFHWPDLVDLGLHRTGLLKGEKLERNIRELLGDKGFSDMRIPFALTTTDIENGQELIHVSGDLVKLVRASCSWPGIFTAVDVDGRLLVDGGVRNSVPTKAAEQLGANFMLAVNPGFSVKDQKIDNLLKALVQSIQIMGEELNMYQSSKANVVIKPILKDVDQFSFEEAVDIIRQGEMAAIKKMTVLRTKLRLKRASFFRWRKR